MSKVKTAASRAYHATVADLPCRLCIRLGQPQTSPTTVHHIREGQGLSQRAHHFLVVALCRDCHQGRHGVHGDRSLLRIAKVDELTLAAETAEAAWRVAA